MKFSGRKSSGQMGELPSTIRHAPVSTHAGGAERVTVRPPADQASSRRADTGRFSLPAARPYRPSPHALRNRLARGLWGGVWLLLFRPSPKPFFGWRRMLLRLFGARIHPTAYVHPSVRIWAPWNLELAAFSCLSPYVDCYAVDRISIGARATVSQYSFLCAAGHDIDSADMTLVTAPIIVADFAWIAAAAFVGPGVTVGEGAVVGARASVFRDVPAWTVIAGNPARIIRQRSRAVADAAGAGAGR